MSIASTLPARELAERLRYDSPMPLVDEILGPPPRSAAAIAALADEFAGRVHEFRDAGLDYGILVIEIQHLGDLMYSEVPEADRDAGVNRIIAALNSPLKASVDADKRESIPKKLRFEVFKRDAFTCQYCGKRAPDVILHCDHIHPVAAGGTTDILNLVTACVDCNLGKGARQISEQAVLSKQLDQLAELQERRDQMELLLAWHKGLAEIDDLPVERLGVRWAELTGYRWTESGAGSARKLIKRFGVERFVSSMETAVSQYVQRDAKGKATADSVNLAFQYIGRIASVDQAEEREPGIKRMFYARGILRRRLSYVNERMAIALMKAAVQAGVSIEFIEREAREAPSWTRFRTEVEIATEQMRLRQEHVSGVVRSIKARLINAPEPLVRQMVEEALDLGVDADSIRGVLAHDIEWPEFHVWLEDAILTLRDVRGDPPPRSASETKETLDQWRRLNDVILGRLK